jgi:hypothetical protein
VCVCGWKMEMQTVMASHSEIYEAMQKKVKQSASLDHCANFQSGTQMSYQ